MLGQPPDILRSVTYVTAQATIDAPLQTVWDAILDFPSYPKWNTFVRSQAIADASFRPLLDPPKPAEGANVLMHVRMPPIGLDDDDKGLRPNYVTISLLDEGNHRIATVLAGYPKWVLRTERWQEVTEEEVDGRMLTKYWTVETFNGPAAWVIRQFLQKNLVVSFQAMAEGLKTYTEQLAKRNS